MTSIQKICPGFFWMARALNLVKYCTAVLYRIREIPKVLIMIWERAVAAETLESCWLERGNPLTDFLISLRSLFYENYYSSESPGQQCQPRRNGICIHEMQLLNTMKESHHCYSSQLMMIMALAFKKNCCIDASLDDNRISINTCCIPNDFHTV